MKYVITGNGVAGINGAISIRRRDPRGSITVISDETPYYFSRTALMYIAMDEMRLEDTEPFERDYFKKNRIDCVQKRAGRIDTSGRKVLLDDGTSIDYDRLLLATGSLPAMFGWPGSDLDGVVNFVTYQDLQEITGTINNVQRAAVIGGGLIGIELAEVLLHHGIEVHFIIREDTFWPRALSPEEGRLVESHMREKGINLHMGKDLHSIDGESGRVKGVTFGNNEQLPVDLVGITTGVKPNIQLASDSGIPVNKGIIVNSKMETGIPDIYAAGDCVERETGDPVIPGIISIWYLSRDMGKTSGINMAGGSSTFTPGSWYNSAKFFDLEYTSVGEYLPVENSAGFVYFENDEKDFSVRIVHRDRIIRGFSMIGSRWDHEALQRFIDNEQSVEYFHGNYRRACFDPEFVTIPEITFT